jgi:hypothetical protein
LVLITVLIGYSVSVGPDAAIGPSNGSNTTS